MSQKVDAKVVLLGQANSGKTCLVERYLHGKFSGTSQNVFFLFFFLFFFFFFFLFFFFFFFFFFSSSCSSSSLTFYSFYWHFYLLIFVNTFILNRLWAQHLEQKPFKWQKRLSLSAFGYDNQIINKKLFNFNINTFCLCQ